MDILIKDLLEKTGTISLLSLFHCDYGYNIEGNNFLILI